jgi:hypothetical protein
VYEVYPNGPLVDKQIHGAFRDPEASKLWVSCAWSHTGLCCYASLGNEYRAYDLIVDSPRTFTVKLYRTPSGIVEPIIPSHTAVPDNWTLISATTMTEGEGL